ncbi:hypothetical protein RhiirC2_759374, partial [Rhizophagus irregularis]
MEPDKDTNTVTIKFCSYCNEPFTEELCYCIYSSEKLAENGNGEAMYNVALSYDNGRGTERN